MVVSKSGSSKRMTMGGCAEKLRQLIAFDAVRTRTAYAEAMFEVESPGGKVTLRVGHAEGKLPRSVRGRRLTVVTAHNPGAERPEEEANRLANERLRAAIEVDGWTYWPAVGRIPSGDMPSRRSPSSTSRKSGRGSWEHNSSRSACSTGTVSAGASSGASDQRGETGRASAVSGWSGFTGSVCNITTWKAPRDGRSEVEHRRR